MGFFSMCPSCLTSSNSGDSETWVRMTMPTTMRIALSRKGTRQAQVPGSLVEAWKAIVDSSRPNGKPACVMPVRRPLRHHGACS